MQRFAFRLENVLRMRKKQEEGIEREFSRRKGELVRIDRQIEEVKGKIRSFVKSSRYEEGVFTAMEAMAVDNYLARMHSSLSGMQVVRRKKAQEVDQFLALLVRARKARKVIEVLRDRQWNRYLEQAQREERNRLDDVTQNLRMNKVTLTIEEPPTEDM